MPTVEGSNRTGWLILLTANETKQIAEPIGDYGGPIAAAAAFIPEPIVTKIISAGAAGLTLLAKKAAKEDRLLGIYVRGSDLRWYLFWYQRLWSWRYEGLSGLPRQLYTYYGSVMTGFAPFVYDGKNPQGLGIWRKAIGI